MAFTLLAVRRNQFLLGSDIRTAAAFSIVFGESQGGQLILGCGGKLTGEQFIDLILGQPGCQSSLRVSITAVSAAIDLSDSQHDALGELLIDNVPFGSRPQIVQMCKDVLDGCLKSSDRIYAFCECLIHRGRTGFNHGCSKPGK